MKKLFLFVSIFISVKCFSQLPPITGTFGAPGTATLTKGVQALDSALWFHVSYSDTSAANRALIKNIGGSVIRVGDTLWIRNASATVWNKLGAGSSALPTWQQTLSVTNGSVLTQNNTITGAYGLTFSGLNSFNIVKNSIGVTQTDTSGILLINNTAAALGNQQMSPGLVWSGYGWKTSAGGASRSVRFRADVLPVQGIPGGIWTLASSINGASYQTLFSIDNNATIQQYYLNMQGLRVGSNDVNSDNTLLGYSSLNGGNTGHYNTSIGYGTLSSNTAGGSNTAVGFSALFSNTVNGFNTAIGSNSMYFNTTGDQNTAVGGNSLYHNTTGIKNNAFGTGTLENNTTGNMNNAYGEDALLANTTGSNSAAMGWNALSRATTGGGNVGIGHQSGKSITTGHENTFIGYNSGYSDNQKITAVNAIAIGENSFTNEDSVVSLGAREIIKKTFLRGNLIDSSYGSGSITGTATYTLQVDANGKIIEGSVGVLSIGALNGVTKSANGAVISGSSLYMQTVDATRPGLITSASQARLDSNFYIHIVKSYDSLAWGKNDSSLWIKALRIRVNSSTITPTTTDSTLSYDLTGLGSVTSISGVNTNGFSFSIATSTTTPAITLSTSVTTNQLIYASSGALTGNSLFTISTSAESLTSGKFISNSTIDVGTDAAILVNRSLSTGSTSAHGFSDQTTFNRPGFSINSYDSKPTINSGDNGGAGQHGGGFQFRPTYSSSDNLNQLVGFSNTATINTGNVTNVDAYEVNSLTGTGTATNHHGFFAHDMGTFATNNYPIYIASQSSSTAFSYIANTVKMTTSNLWAGISTPLIIDALDNGNYPQIGYNILQATAGTEKFVVADYAEKVYFGADSINFMFVGSGTANLPIVYSDYVKSFTTARLFNLTTVQFKFKEIAAPGTPASGYGTMYPKSDHHIYWKGSDGTEYDLTSGGGSVTTLAAIGSSPNANGATISSATLNLEPASASFGGVVTTGTQTFAGAKTLTSNFTVQKSTADLTNLLYASGSGFYSILQIKNLDANYSYVEFLNNTTQDWAWGLYGSNDIQLKDITNNKTAIYAKASTAGPRIGFGAAAPTGVNLYLVNPTNSEDATMTIASTGTGGYGVINLTSTAGDTRLQYFAGGDGNNYIQSGNEGGSANKPLKITGNSAAQGSTVTIKFATTNIDKDVNIGIAGSSLGTLSLSGNTSGTITIKSQAAAGTYNFNLPISSGSSGDLFTSGGGGANPHTYTAPSDLNLTKASNFLTAQTTALSTFINYAAVDAGIYRIGGNITITAVSVDVLQLQVTYTDETSTSRTITMLPVGGATLSTTGAYVFPVMDIWWGGSGNIVVKTVLAVGGGSITYNVAASVQKVFNTPF